MAVGYDLKIAVSAQRTLARLPEPAIAAIIEFVTGPLLANPERLGKPLKFELEGHRSARRGPYRIVYRIDDAERAVRSFASTTARMSTGRVGRYQQAVGRGYTCSQTLEEVRASWVPY